ncbi:MAG: hypothetical protein OET18_05295 [Desulfobacterales bacterium]|nr:hypothetical protein [Desulfobacterales bacterium]
MKKKALEWAIGMVLDYADEIINMIIPSNMDEDNKKDLISTVLLVYAAAKGWGKSIVADTENTMDDKGIEALIKSCEEISKKLEFSLDATKY